MRIEKSIHDYYEQKIAETAPAPLPEDVIPEKRSIAAEKFAALVFAAALIFSFVPFFYYAGKTSELSARASVFCIEYEIGNRISEGIINLHGFAD